MTMADETITPNPSAPADAEAPTAVAAAHAPKKAKGEGKGKHAPQTFWGVGRRKSSTARVRILLGSGKIVINGRDCEKYFCLEADRTPLKHPIELVGMTGKVDVLGNVRGGGTTGQSGAMTLGIARALIEMNGEFRPTLSKAGLLTRDSREVERKKVGRRGAR